MSQSLGTDAKTRKEALHEAPDALVTAFWWVTSTPDNSQSIESHSAAGDDRARETEPITYGVLRIATSLKSPHECKPQGDIGGQHERDDLTIHLFEHRKDLNAKTDEG